MVSSGAETCRTKGGQRGGAHLAGALQLQQQTGLARKQELAEAELLQAAALQHAAARRPPRCRQQRGHIVPGAPPACAPAPATLDPRAGPLGCYQALSACAWQRCQLGRTASRALGNIMSPAHMQP